MATKFKYSKYPYAKEIVDLLSANDPTREVIIYKPASNGPTSGIIPGIGGYALQNAIEPFPYYANITPDSEIKRTRIFGMSEHGIYKLYGYWMKRKYAVRRILNRLKH